VKHFEAQPVAMAEALDAKWIATDLAKRQTIKKGLVGALVLFLALVPFGVTSPYFYHVVVIAGIFAMLALSLNLILGYVGQFPLGHQLFFGLGAYTAALISPHTGGNFVIAMASSVALCGLVGLLIGLPTLKMKGPAFVIVSLAFNEIFFLIAWNWLEFTGGPDGITGIPYPSLFGLALKNKTGLYYLMVILVVVVAILNLRIMSAKTGRKYLAIRENPELAQSLGVNPYMSKLQAFVISAMFGGLAGCFYAQFERFVSPSVFGFDYLTMMLVMVWVGGLGTIAGPIVGAILITFLHEYLDVFGIWRWVIFGVILLACVFYMPKGLAGTAASILKRIRRRGTSHAD
jgi:branched-chain amino acid transport system permease protein